MAHSGGTRQIYWQRDWVLQTSRSATLRHSPVDARSFQVNGVVDGVFGATRLPPLRRSWQSSKLDCSRPSLGWMITAYPNTFPQVTALHEQVYRTESPDQDVVAPLPPSKPDSAGELAARPLKRRLSPIDIDNLINEYRAGAYQKHLAQKYGIGMTSVGKILRTAGARKLPTPDPA